MRLTKEYFFYLISADAMLDLDFINKSIFPDNLMQLHYVCLK